MDPVRLILTALAAGAEDTGSAAVRDACAGLRERLNTLLAGRGDAERMLARYSESGQAGEDQLAAELAAAGAGDEEGVLSAAQAVLSVADEEGWRAGRYTVEAHGGGSAQGGDST